MGFTKQLYLKKGGKELGTFYFYFEMKIEFLLLHAVLPRLPRDGGLLPRGHGLASSGTSPEIGNNFKS